MFWSGNYIAAKEVGKLLTEKNVTLTQMLEADDILQECKADNKALISYLTKPQILAELITLILEEPPKDVELSSQYRHANIASEVLTSDLSMLSNQLAMDVVQMNRICDFVNRDPPLNPLLASYFSKTIGMLLDQRPKQDWCLYQIVCLRVLDIFRARRDFLPNLLRHMCTSAIADTFNYFIRLDYPFKEIIMEWFEEHQFLESLIQIICGTYEPAELQPPAAGSSQEPPGLAGPPPPGPPPPGPPPLDPPPARDPNRLEPAEEPEKAQKEYAEKLDNQKDVELQNRIDNRVGNAVSDGAADVAGVDSCSLDNANGNDEPEAEPGALQRWNQERAQRERDDEIQAAEQARLSARRAARLRAVAADNAAELLCNLVANAAGLACDFETMRSWNSSKRKAHALVSRLRCGGGVRALLAGMFTATGARRPPAVAHGARVLLALLRYEAAPDQMTETEWAEWAAATSVERAVAPHIPLLHHALLRDPAADTDDDDDTPPPPPPPTQKSDRSNEESGGCQSSSSNGETSEGAGSGGGQPNCCGAPAASQGPLAEGVRGGGAGRVGAARLGAAALLAQLACSELDDVANAIISLGTAGVLAQLSWAHENNNFLHAHMHAFVRNALYNARHSHRYADHLINECGLLTQLMDLFEENEDRTTGRARAGYMGHVVLMLRRFDEDDCSYAVDAALQSLAPPLVERWHAFRERLWPLLEKHDKPLSGFYPSENLYEVENVADTMASNYDLGDGSGLDGEPPAVFCGWPDDGDGGGDGDGDRDGEGDAAEGSGADADYDLFGNITKYGPMDQEVHPTWTQLNHNVDIAKQYFQKVGELIASQKGPWDTLEEPAAAALPMDEPLPWENAEAGEGEGSEAGAACGGECWANFAESFGQPSFHQDQVSEPASGAGASGATGEAGAAGAQGAETQGGDGEIGATGAEASLQRMQLGEDAASTPLADNLRAAMSSMTPDAVANIVNANLAAPLDDDAER